MGRPHETVLAGLLAEGLDLCVRARKLDERCEAAVLGSAAVKNNRDGQGSGTIALWVQDQYERDLEAWQNRARETMTRLGYG